MGSVTSREEINSEYKWKLSTIYSGEEEWEIDFQKVKSKLGELSSYEGKTTKDAEREKPQRTRRLCWLCFN